MKSHLQWSLMNDWSIWCWLISKTDRWSATCRGYECDMCVHWRSTGWAWCGHWTCTTTSRWLSTKWALDVHCDFFMRAQIEHDARTGCALIWICSCWTFKDEVIWSDLVMLIRSDLKMNREANWFSRMLRKLSQISNCNWFRWSCWMVMLDSVDSVNRGAAGFSCRDWDKTSKKLVNLSVEYDKAATKQEVDLIWPDYVWIEMQARAGSTLSFFYQIRVDGRAGVDKVFQLMKLKSCSDLNMNLWETEKLMLKHLNLQW